MAADLDSSPPATTESSHSELEGEEEGQEQKEKQTQEEEEEKEEAEMHQLEGEGEEEEEEKKKEDDDSEEEEEEEVQVPSPKRQRSHPSPAAAAATTFAGGGAVKRRAHKARAAVPSGPSSRAVADPPALVPCIQLATPIPLELLSQGLTACMRSSLRKSEPAQAALFDALYGIRMEIEDRISDGDKMAITYYKQAKRNDERQATALLARKMERPRAAQVLGALLKKWNESTDKAPASSSPTR